MITNGVKKIGDAAFEGCTDLKKVIIGSNVEEIGASAFSGCTGLDSIVIPNCVKNLGSNVFWGCSSLKRVEIGNDVNEIKDYSFAFCGGLLDAVIGEGITNICNMAFSGCTSLKTITALPLDPPNVHATAFEDVSEDVFLYVHEEAVERYATTEPWKNFVVSSISTPILSFSVNNFKYMVSNPIEKQVVLTGYEEIPEGTLIIPETVSYEDVDYAVVGIGRSAFENCASINELVTSNSIESIGDRAFLSCSNLSRVHLNGNITTIGDYAFAYCPFAEIDLPENLEHVENGTFYECVNLEEIVIPNSVDVVDEYAFYDCKSLTKLTIGSEVSGIYGYAFGNCTGLKEITSYAIDPPGLHVFGLSFDNVDCMNVIVHVPYGTSQSYKDRVHWNVFKYEEMTAINNPIIAENIKIKNGVLCNPLNSFVIIYNADGGEVYRGSDTEIKMSAGVYIVRSMGVSKKVVF